jgi:hypothetical protein
MQTFFTLLITLVLFCAQSVAEAKSFSILNLNVFDQLQGDWTPDFRARRMGALGQWIEENSPDIIVFQEARGILPGDKNGGSDSIDADLAKLKPAYAYRRYIHEMTGQDGASYGYWMGAKRAPQEEWSDGFAFPGGVARKVQAAIWRDLPIFAQGIATQKNCIGLLSLHLSYQNSQVRQKEADWILAWLKKAEAKCPHWIVLGDFNADSDTKEIQLLLKAGLVSFADPKQATVGAWNPIRQIYGKDIPSKTIDWAFARDTLGGKGEVVFDRPVHGEWLSDHAGVWLRWQ